MTIAVFLLIRIEAGVLACRDGAWTFSSDIGPVRSGALEVAIGLGGFLLLRLGDRRRGCTWLPLQRLGSRARVACAGMGAIFAAAGRRSLDAARPPHL